MGRGCGYGDGLMERVFLTTCELASTGHADALHTNTKPDADRDSTFLKYRTMCWICSSFPFCRGTAAIRVHCRSHGYSLVQLH